MRIFRFVLSLVVSISFVQGVAAFAAAPPIPANHIRIHYFRNDSNYTGWTVYAFGNTTEDQGNFGGGPVQISGMDSFGAYFDVGITAGATDVGIIVHNGDNKDPGPDEHVNPSTQGNEYWQLSGVVGLSTTQPPTTSQKNPAIPANTARVHFFRPDNNYAGWTVYAFNDTTADTGNYNGGPIQQTGTDAYGAYYDVPLKPNAQDIGFIVHNIQTGSKNTPADLHLNVALYNEVWIISGDPMVYLTQPTAAQLLNANFLKLQAFWIDRTTIAIQSAYATGATYSLLGSPTANLMVTPTGVSGPTAPSGNAFATVPLKLSGNGLSAAQLLRFPQLKGYATLTLPASLKAADYRKLVQDQLAVEVQKADGTLVYATGVQDAGVLDDLYSYGGKLGVVFPSRGGVSDGSAEADDQEPGAVKIKVWAPTAQTMQLQLFSGAADTAPAKTVAMKDHNGVWVSTLDSTGLASITCWT